MNDSLALLVVEDDDDDFFLLEEMLKKHPQPLRVDRAVTVEDALEITARQPYDLLLLDYRLGAHTGLDLMQRLKDQGVTAPIIFLTGQGDEDTAVAAMKAGALDYLAKSKLTQPALSRAISYARCLQLKEEAIRQARCEIETRERHFRALVENSSDAITLCDASRRVFYGSPSCHSVLGYQPQELLGARILDLVHPDDSNALAQVHTLSLARPGLSVDLEYRLRQKDGSWRWIEATGVNRLDDPDVQGIVVHHRDVTGQRQAREQLRSTAETLRAMFQASPLALVQRDRQGNILSFNPAAERIFGYSESELAGGPVPDGPQSSTAREGLRRVLAGESVVGFETPAARKDGSLLQVAIWMAPLRGAAGAITGAITILADITEQKRIEQERARDQQALKLNERRLEALLELNRMNASTEEEITSFALEQGIGLTGSRYGYIGFVDESEESVVKHVWSQDVLRDCRMEDRVPSLRACDSGLWAAAVAARHPIITNDYPALPDKKGYPPGHIALSSHLSVPILDGERIVAVAGVANKPVPYDDSDVRQLTLLMEGMWRILRRQRSELAMRNLQQQLLQSQKIEAIGQLAGGIAHDFNNLLMIISSYSELLAEGVKDNRELRHHAEEVQKAARKAATLTGQLLAFSRKQVLTPRLMDLNQTIADAGKLLPRLIAENIEIAVVTGKHLWPVKADPVQIDQVLMNLAVNARDAMPKGGKLTLETRNVQLDEEYARTHPTVQPGDYVMLAVSDTGTGIMPEVLPRIFEPFFTTKEIGHGTGLGLPMVYGIVKQSGGTLWVYSEVGRGTVFKIYLKRAQAEAQAAQPEKTAQPNCAGDETLLLVEDEVALRQVTSEFLRARGYTVLQASSGAEAMAVARGFKGTIHVLVTDVIMPGISGRELAEQLLQLSPRTKVLYMSGYTEATVVRHGVGPNTAFLQKPFAMAELAAKVRELLGMKTQLAA